MKQSKFTDHQIVNILKQAEAGMPVAQICRECNIDLPSLSRTVKRLHLS